MSSRPSGSRWDLFRLRLGLFQLGRLGPSSCTPARARPPAPPAVTPPGSAIGPPSILSPLPRPKANRPGQSRSGFFFARLRRIFWPAVKFLPVVKISSRGQNFGVRSKFCLSVRFLVLVKISVGGQNLSSTTSSTITSAYLSSRAA